MRRRWLWVLALLLREGASLAPGGARARPRAASARFASRSDMGPRPKRPKLKESFIDREERKAAKKWSNMEEKRKTTAARFRSRLREERADSPVTPQGRMVRSATDRTIRTFDHQNSDRNSVTIQEILLEFIGNSEI